MSANAFSPQGNTTKFAATDTASTAKQALSTPQGQGGALVYNSGLKDGYLAWSLDSDVEAVVPGTDPANGMPIPAGAIMTLTFPPNAYFSVICGTGDTTTLWITRGEGN